MPEFPRHLKAMSTNRCAGRVRTLLGAVAAFVLTLPTMVLAGDTSVRGGFWGGFEPGYGSLHRSSDQEARRRDDCFTMAFKLGYTPVSPLRLGLELGGWLIEIADLNDPTKGVGLSQYNLFLQAYPLSANNFYLRAGGGRAIYWNDHPLEYGSSGWGFTLGAGYDLPVRKGFSVTPEIHYSSGDLGEVKNRFISITGRRYHASTISLGFTYR